MRCNKILVKHQLLPASSYWLTCMEKGFVRINGPFLTTISRQKKTHFFMASEKIFAGRMIGTVGKKIHRRDSCIWSLRSGGSKDTTSPGWGWECDPNKSDVGC